MPKHTLIVIKGLGVILVAGVVCFLLEKGCEKIGAPTYIVLGAHVMAVALFILDGMVLLGTGLAWALMHIIVAFIKAWKRIKREL